MVKENSNKRLVLSAFVFLLWIIFCWQGFVTVVNVWWGNEIFNHGFFILPGVIYLIYLKRSALLAQPFETSWLSLFFIVPTVLLYVVGVAGDVQLFMHAATFALFPLLVWMLIGTRAALTIFFPLCFTLFSVPVGEQLIPYLQEIAADGSVWLLKLTGVPLFRSGLYIEIPQGRFLVAEACSGVSFFIASVVIGSLYSYLNFRSAKRRIIFVFISLIFPIVANVIRVYGIILIAYWTDMEYAAGADHLIYGWFFFALVILFLLGIGELMRESGVEWESAPQQPSSVWKVNLFPIVSVIALLVASKVWVNTIRHVAPAHASASYSYYKAGESCESGEIALGPIFNNPSETRKSFRLLNGGCMVTVYEAWFSGVDNELISDLNRPYDQQKWSLVSTSVQSVYSEGLNSNLPVYTVTTPNGKEAKYTLWYEIGEHVFSSKVDAKLYETMNALMGHREAGKLVIIALPVHENIDQAIMDFQ
ncbi:exosortase A [Alteromonas antoniana]|uniref:exosortase A n=1 Tax=Alteromonas antoniana TaxID=2803813 RepID=UPI001C47CE37